MLLTGLWNYLARLTAQIGQANQKYEQTKDLLHKNPELPKQYDPDSLKDQEDELRTKLVDLTR
jgi:CHASE3 domain sensor protein